MKKLIVILAMLTSMNVSGQWQPDVRLTNDPADSYTSYNNAWCIASSGLFVHVVWFDYRDGNDEIYYKRSIDAGVSWGADVRLTNNTGSSWEPSVAVSGTTVHVAWEDYRDGNREIYYKRSTDAGVSWGADTRLTNNSSYSKYPSVTVSGSVVHVVWQDNRDGNYEIYYKRSTDAGISWGADTRLTNNIDYSEFPSVAVSGPVVHIVWHDYRDGETEIYYKRSIDAGISWGTDIRLTNNPAYSSYPSVAVSGTVVHVLWDDDRHGYDEIYYKHSTDAGVSWGADTRLTNDTNKSAFPSVAVSGLFVHVVWWKQGGNWEIYYKRSIDAGNTWSSETQLTNYFSLSSSPSVAVSGSVVHVVWWDNRDWNREIYYKRDPTGNPIGIKNISSEIPSYSLEQNYPNPFNPMTNVKFQIANTPLNPLSRGEMISLKVFDITGKEIETLVNEQLEPGTYETTFNASTLTSGVYFYKLSAGDFSETKKMLLLK
jgi:hypothetical protein